MSKFDPLDGPGMKAIRQMQKTAELLSGPKWIRDLPSHTHSLNLVTAATRLGGLRDADAISAFAKLGETSKVALGHSAVWSQMRTDRELVGTAFAQSKLFDANSRLAKLYEPVLAANTLNGALLAFKGVEDRFGLASVLSKLSSPSDALVARTLASIVNTASLMAMPRSLPISVLSPVDDSEEDLSLLWADPQEPPRLSVAALRASADAPALHIDVKVTCWICKKALLSKGEFSWEGDREGALEVRVIPICATCSSHSPESLLALEKAIDDFARPALRIISGGESDGVRRGQGKLWLVKDDDADDEDK
jgi:hypothetical protein